MMPSCDEHDGYVDGCRECLSASFRSITRPPRAIKQMTPSQRVGWYTGPREPSGCRLWLGCLSTGGYPSIAINGLSTRVGRFLLGLKPRDGLVAMHVCDTPMCVEPTHFRAGTQIENTADMNAKGRRRGTRGVDSPNAKLTPELVRWIRQQAALGVSQHAIAKAVGTTRAPVWLVIKRKTWKHVD